MTQAPLEIRAYQNRDREACLRVFDSNLPMFFAPDEREEFALYLDDPIERGPDAEYLVLEMMNTIVACGGFYVANHEAGLAWGMVAQHHHREGFGKRLLLERLRRIAARPAAKAILLDTSQRSQGFFARLGFEVVKITEDDYDVGLHRVDMRLELNAETRTRILETT